jgi:Tol biopolymer transport system component
MQQSSHQKSHSSLGSPVFSIGRRGRLAGYSGLLLVTVCLIAFWIHGCMHAHTRPLGHEDITLSVSPDGNLLLFNADGQGGRDLYLLDLRTSHVTRIAGTPDYETAPSFAPDGKSIVYAAGQPGDRADHLFVRDLASGHVTQITSGNDNDSTPAFFPDGKRIVFTRDTHYNWGGLAASWSGGGSIWSIDRNGSDLKRLLPESIFAISPRVSPDGKTLLWRDIGGMFTAPADGTGAPRQIADNARAAAFSPRGDLIVFQAGRYVSDQKIYAEPLNGGTPALIAQTSTGCINPVFSPDGRTIYYFVDDWSSGSPEYTLWQVGTYGGAPKQLASTKLFDDPMHWKP